MSASPAPAPANVLRAHPTLNGYVNGAPAARFLADLVTHVATPTSSKESS